LFRRGQRAPEVIASKPYSRRHWHRSRLAAVTVLGGLTIFEFSKLEVSAAHSNAALYAYGITVTGVVLLQMATAMLRYRDLALYPGDDPADMPATARQPLVSCMVAVHNEEVVIEQCVRSLAAQTYANKEIIIVDDASTDHTVERLRELELRYPIELIALTKNVGKKRALAVAMLHARGELYAFSDSDSTWAPDALERAVHVFVHHPDVGAVSGHCRALNATHNLLTKIQDSWYEGQFSVRKAFESAFGAVTCVSGPMAVFRREAIHNYIPAWEADRFLGDEFRFATDRTLTGFVLASPDKAAALKSRYKGSPFLKVDYPWQLWRVVYSKSARAWTVVPENISQLFKQQVRWKKSFLRNLWFTGGFYWQRSLFPAAVYYLHAVFVLAGPFIAFRHLIYLPLNGNIESGLLYLGGITLIGSMFALAFRREEPQSTTWIYRPLMSLLSTTVLTWLVFYSVLTIKKATWSRA
jgi:cellulose synthase/poly-beta-1,6-N-acetylglucosamine synthase-like glycosyltransferase